MDALGLAGISGLLLFKEAGVPVPVPGDLIVLTAGIAAASGELDPVIGLPVIVGATIIGGVIQFGLVRGPGRAAVLAVLRRVGVSRERIDRAGEGLRRRGATGVATARMTPGLRVVTIAAAALAGVRFAQLAEGLSIGNGVFVGGHFLAGFVVGKPALAAISAIGGVAVAVVLLAVVGAVGWVALRRARPRVTGDGSADPAGLQPVPVSAWADAACPACLALALVIGERDQGPAA
jgi:membrane protein DedA with SNARE-associated domain